MSSHLKQLSSSHLTGSSTNKKHCCLSCRQATTRCPLTQCKASTLAEMPAAVPSPTTWLTIWSTLVHHVLSLISTSIQRWALPLESLTSRLCGLTLTCRLVEAYYWPTYQRWALPLESLTSGLCGLTLTCRLVEAYCWPTYLPTMGLTAGEPDQSSVWFDTDLWVGRGLLLAYQRWALPLESLTSGLCGLTLTCRLVEAYCWPTYLLTLISIHHFLFCVQCYCG